jgi:chemotaxis protein MotB
MKKKAKPKKENGERWLLTYSDMITLLLALFILLYGMSTVDQTKYEQLAASLNASLGDGNGASIFDGSGGILDKNGNAILQNNKGANGENSSQGTTTATPAPTQGAAKNPESLTTEKEMNDLKNGVNNALKDMKIENAISTSLSEKGLTITFKNDEFFDIGKADLKDSMKKSLNSIANLLNRINNHIEIEGYTDNVPINSWIYPSNWHLSVARAASVALYLQEEGVEVDRLTATGHGENDPIAPNDTKEGRSRNRRIVVTILYNDATGMEFKK